MDLHKLAVESLSSPDARLVLEDALRAANLPITADVVR